MKKTSSAHNSTGGKSISTTWTMPAANTTELDYNWTLLGLHTGIRISAYFYFNANIVLLFIIKQADG